MAIHGAVRKDKLSEAHAGNLESVKHSADMDNGFIVQLGGLSTGEREMKDVKVPDATSINTDSILLIATPELTYLAGQTIVDFYNPAGTPALAYLLRVGDIFTITDNVITGTTAVGSGNQYVGPEASSLKLKAVSAAPTTRFIGVVIEKTTIYGQAASVIQVKSN